MPVDVKAAADGKVYGYLLAFRFLYPLYALFRSMPFPSLTPFAHVPPLPAAGGHFAKQKSRRLFCT